MNNSSLRDTIIPNGYLNKASLDHFARMSVCNLWRGDIEWVKEYNSIIESIVEMNPLLFQEMDEELKSRFMYISICINEGIEPSPWQITHMKKRVNVALDLPIDFSERDVVKSFISSNEAMGIIHGSEAVISASLEEQLDDGRADLIVRSGRDIHVVEFKADLADHSVIGQLKKYMRNVGCKIQNNLYDNVRGWVVAREISRSAMVELEKAGVSIILFQVSK
jgi:hypothetical protein